MEFVNFKEKKDLEVKGLLDGNGFVKVVNVSPELCPKGYTPEYLIAKAARASYNQDNKSPAADKRLLEFLVRNNHTSPLEMCSITFCMKLPVAICRQLLRHRTGKFNEFSQRYTEITEEVDRFRLDKTAMSLRGPISTNLQASEYNLTEEQIPKILDKIKELEILQDQVFKNYKDLLELGYAKELARFYLPVSTYTIIYVQFDLNNLMKFLRLRCAPDAQLEIKVYADAMKKLASQFFPNTFDIYAQYENSFSIGKYELQMIKERKIPEEVKSKTHIEEMKNMAENFGIELN